MGLNKNKDLKLYFSIGEVSKLLAVNPSTVRYWEKEFDHLNPKINPSGVRFYTKEDIEEYKLVQHLVKSCGLTVKGAKTRLNSNKERVNKVVEVIEALEQIKSELLTMKQDLEKLQ